MCLSANWRGDFESPSQYESQQSRPEYTRRVTQFGFQKHRIQTRIEDIFHRLGDPLSIKHVQIAHAAANDNRIGVKDVDDLRNGFAKKMNEPFFSCHRRRVGFDARHDFR